MTSSERLVAKSLKLPVHPIVSRRSRRARAVCSRWEFRGTVELISSSTRAAMRPREVPPDGQFRARERADREDRQRRRLHAAIGARASASRAARAPTTASSSGRPFLWANSPTIATGADRGRRARAPETRAPIAVAATTGPRRAGADARDATRRRRGFPRIQSSSDARIRGIDAVLAR